MKNNLQMLFFLFLLNSCNENKEMQNFSAENDWTISINILVDSCWNAQKTEQLKIISNEKFTRTMNGIEMAENQEEIKAHMQVFFNGFPDLKLEMNEIYSANNRAFTKWIFTGTNTGIFGESPATGKKVKILGSSVIYFNSQGKIIQEDVFYNELDLLQQLGYTINLPIVE
jgi:steroid delta-isomerase-like uncharacterized protein